ncbi:DUF2269 domain-containing protein [Actinophytocola sp.]|uniref:DUF2269 domain-containing protein n=1 Tax=Actinophytocola sp. TaxID=1872138 RepID=UPI003D6A02F0
MTQGPRLRRFLLVVHVTTSVGWLGAVLAFLGLAVVGLTSADDGTVRGVYLVMAPAGRYVLMPLAVASLVIGIVQSLGSRWGLVRHYWVLFKLVITVIATLLLLRYLATFDALAAAAADPDTDLADVRSASPLLHATLALLVLLAATVLAVYKPRGAIRWRRTT